MQLLRHKTEWECRVSVLSDLMGHRHHYNLQQLCRRPHICNHTNRNSCISNSMVANLTSSKHCKLLPVHTPPPLLLQRTQDRHPLTILVGTLHSPLLPFLAHGQTPSHPIVKAPVHLSLHVLRLHQKGRVYANSLESAHLRKLSRPTCNHFSQTTSLMYWKRPELTHSACLCAAVVASVAEACLLCLGATSVHEIRIGDQYIETACCRN